MIWFGHFLRLQTCSIPWEQGSGLRSVSPTHLLEAKNPPATSTAPFLHIIALLVRNSEAGPAIGRGTAAALPNASGETSPLLRELRPSGPLPGIGASLPADSVVSRDYRSRKNLMSIPIPIPNWDEIS
jgi:hypothetical protein